MPEPEATIVCSYEPIQKLYTAARELIDSCLAKGGLVALAAIEELKKAVTAMEAAAKENDKLAVIRDFARELYIDSDCDIDVDEHNLTHHNGELEEDGGGYWVGAWLWVGDSDANDALGKECSECERRSQGIESTYCGSMCEGCRRKHAEECDVCREDFVCRGI